MASTILLLATAATLTISLRDSRASWTYEIISFLGAAFAVWRLDRVPRVVLQAIVPVAAIALWGFAQFVSGATVYPYATVDASLRMSALAATFVISAVAFRSAKLRDRFLAVFSGLGLAIAVLGVLAYYTSPGNLLWLFPNSYPDSWGVFLSRNNFAQFLELGLPVALWRARNGATSASLIAAALLAAGVASASRAGAVLLVAEAIVCLFLMRARIQTKTGISNSLKLVVASAIFIALAGSGEFWGRFQHSNPFEYRREIAHSTIAMIAEHPWRGFGLGTFAAVYPAYAEFDPGKIVDHAHNDWLEWASEGGLPFAAAWVALALVLLRPAMNSVWGIGIVAVLLHAIVDYPFARFGISAWFFVLAGALAAREPKWRPDSPASGDCVGEKYLGPATKELRRY